MESPADDFIKGDLCYPRFVEDVIDEPFDELYQLEANIRGAGFVFS